MAAESYKSTRPGDAKFKPSVAGSFGSDKTVGIDKGGTGNKGTKGGVTTEMDLKLGTRMAKAAANGKPY